MAATIKVRELLHRVSSSLLDLNGQFERWKEDELVHALNDAQRAVAKYLPSACLRVDALKLAAGSRQSIELIPADRVIPGDGSAAAITRGALLLDVVRNLGATGLVVGRAVRVGSREHADSFDPAWHTRTGTEVTEFFFDPRVRRNFYVSPAAPATPAVWVEIVYQAEPTPIIVPAVGAASLYGYAGASTALLSIDDTYADDLVNYVMARAFMKDSEIPANGALADRHARFFISSINAQAAAMTGVNPNLQMLPFTPQALSAAR